MHKMIKLDEFLSDHAANNMVRILKYVKDNVGSLGQGDIMELFNLKTDLDYFQFMVDLEGFRDLYIDYSLSFQTEVRISGRNKSIKKGGN